MGRLKNPFVTQTTFLVSQCAGISDPFHFYLGYFLPLVGLSQIERIHQHPRRVLYQPPHLASLQAWIELGLRVRGLQGEPLQGDVLQEYLRRRRWTSRVIRRDTTLLFPDSDNVHKLGSIQFRLLLRRAKRRLSTQGLLEKSIPTLSGHIGQACIMMRTNPDPLKFITFARHVPNLNEIGDYLELKGWKVVYLDAAIEAPEVILKKVSGSSLLVGQYGAGLSHSMWLSRGSAVIEISSPADNPMAPWAYRRLAESGSLKYIVSKCQPSWTAPASITEFEKAYLEISVRELTPLDKLRIFLEVYVHIYLGRILISMGLKNNKAGC